MIIAGGLLLWGWRAARRGVSFYSFIYDGGRMFFVLRPAPLATFVRVVCECLWTMHVLFVKRKNRLGGVLYCSTFFYLTPPLYLTRGDFTFYGVILWVFWDRMGNYGMIDWGI